MRTAQITVSAAQSANEGWPNASEIAALRAWVEGIAATEVAMRYWTAQERIGRNARGLLAGVKRQLAAWATNRGRLDLAQAVAALSPSAQSRKGLATLLDSLERLAPAAPLFGDELERWLPARTARTLRAAGMRTLADLTLRVPRRRRWWSAIEGLGAAGARQVEAFFAAHPALTERARALITIQQPDLSPWEHLEVPELVDGSQGRYRAPARDCLLRANNDYDAINAWLQLHESAATQRAYRKEAERLLLWAIAEQGRALSSLSTEDATAYRRFLRQPTPRLRWVGPARPRSSPEWRPFTGALAPRSVAYALSVLNAMFRWLVEQRYLLANPFAGVKVRGSSAAPVDARRAFTAGEWILVRVVADGLEWSYGWKPSAAQRMRFVLDFCYSTGLRANELVSAKLGQLERDRTELAWLRVRGKGNREGRVAVPALASQALDRYLMERKLSVSPSRWDPLTPLVGSVETEQGITAGRLWAMVKRFFATVAEVVRKDNPALADKLLQASTHWMRHTHATHLLDSGADLAAVRDNLRHASINTTSVYLHSDDVRRANQVGEAFKRRQ